MCAGIANSTGMPRWLVRLLFIFFAPWALVSIAVYIVAAMLMEPDHGA